MTDFVYRVVIDDPGPRHRTQGFYTPGWILACDNEDDAREDVASARGDGCVAHVERAPIGTWETHE